MSFTKSAFLALAFTSIAAAGCAAESGGGEIAEELMVDAPNADAQVMTSDGLAPATCPNTSPLVDSVSITGWFADNIDIGCGVPSGLSYNGKYVDIPVHSGYWVWSGWFSEDTSPNLRTCTGNQWMTGVRCSGNWCDDMSIRCSEIYYNSNNAPVVPSNCYWSDWYSDDSLFLANWNPAQTWFVRGIKCSGSYCDDLSFYVCSM